MHPNARAFSNTIRSPTIHSLTCEQIKTTRNTPARTLKGDLEKGTQDKFTTGEWEVGLCGCCTHCVPNCLMSTCCPCVTLAQITALLGWMPFTVALLVSLLMGFGTGGVGFAIMIWMARKETRERYQIPGGCCGDCLASCCCGCCAAAQVATHIRSYKPGSCGFGPQDTLPAFQRS